MIKRIAMMMLIAGAAVAAQPRAVFYDGSNFYYYPTNGGGAIQTNTIDVGGGSSANWSTNPATSSVNMMGYSLTNSAGISNPNNNALDLASGYILTTGGISIDFAGRILLGDWTLNNSAIVTNATGVEEDPIFGSVSNSLVTTNDTRLLNLTNATVWVDWPSSDHEAASAGFVRSMAMRGATWHFTQNVTNPAWVKTTNFVALSGTQPTAVFSNTIASVTGNTYIAGGISTQSYSVLRSPVSFDVWMKLVTANPASKINVHAEFYYIYNGTTNQLGDWESVDQEVPTTLERREFVVPFEEPAITGLVQVVGYLKSGTVSGPANGVEIVAGGTYSSHMDIEGTIGTGGGSVVVDVGTSNNAAFASNGVVTINSNTSRWNTALYYTATGTLNMAGNAITNGGHISTTNLSVSGGASSFSYDGGVPLTVSRTTTLSGTMINSRNLSTNLGAGATLNFQVSTMGGAAVNAGRFGTAITANGATANDTVSDFTLYSKPSGLGDVSIALTLTGSGAVQITPRSASPTAISGGLYFDSDDKKMYACTNGTTWVSIGSLP